MGVLLGAARVSSCNAAIRLERAGWATHVRVVALETRRAKDAQLLNLPADERRKEARVAPEDVELQQELVADPVEGEAVADEAEGDEREPQGARHRGLAIARPSALGRPRTILDFAECYLRNTRMASR